MCGPPPGDTHAREGRGDRPCRRICVSQGQASPCTHNLAPGAQKHLKPTPLGYSQQGGARGEGPEGCTHLTKGCVRARELRRVRETTNDRQEAPVCVASEGLPPSLSSIPNSFHLVSFPAPLQPK